MIPAMQTQENAGQQFDAVALEYDFMAEVFHSSEFFLNHLSEQRTLALELGCGSGLMTRDLANVFQRVIAIDLSQDLLKIAQTKRAAENVLYCQMDISQMGLASGFDTIVNKNVFHHLDDISHVLEQLKILLKSGGRLIITDVISERETPPSFVYLIGAVQKYLPNLRSYGRKTANRIFRFRVSKHWLSHLASDRYLSQDKFVQLYRKYLPDCVFPHAGCLIWDKPIDSAVP